jgi:tRNA-specific adenosine deaminase 3
MVALNNVAIRQLKEIPKPNSIITETKNNDIEENYENYAKKYIENILETSDSSETETLNINLLKSLNQNDYLCTSFSIFLTHEPCSMCAMALIHSRISKVYYVFDRINGYLNTNCKLHCLPSLNHSYEVFKAKNPSELDSDLIEYFNKN